MGGKLSQFLKTNLDAKKISLQSQNLDKKDMKVIGKFLKENDTVEELDLSYNTIGDDGVVFIAKALESNTTLTRIVLHHCGIGDAGCENLTKALSTNITVREINLSNNRIRDSGFIHIADMLSTTKVMEKLIAKFNMCGEKGGAALAVAMRANRSLRTLDLESNQIGSVAAWEFADALLQNTVLLELCLSSNIIGDPGGRALAEMLMRNETLESLLLGGNQMSTKVKDDIASNLRARRTAQHFVRESAFNSELKRYEEEQAARRDVETVRAEVKSKLTSLTTMDPARSGPTPSSTSTPDGTGTALERRKWSIENMGSAGAAGGAEPGPAVAEPSEYMRRGTGLSYGGAPSVKPAGITAAPVRSPDDVRSSTRGALNRIMSMSVGDEHYAAATAMPASQGVTAGGSESAAEDAEYYSHDPGRRVSYMPDQQLEDQMASLYARGTPVAEQRKKSVGILEEDAAYEWSHTDTTFHGRQQTSAGELISQPNYPAALDRGRSGSMLRSDMVPRAYMDSNEGGSEEDSPIMRAQPYPPRVSGLAGGVSTGVLAFQEVQSDGEDDSTVRTDAKQRSFYMTNSQSSIASAKSMAHLDLGSPASGDSGRQAAVDDDFRPSRSSAHLGYDIAVSGIPSVTTPPVMGPPIARVSPYIPPPVSGDDVSPAGRSLTQPDTPRSAFGLPPHSGLGVGMAAGGYSGESDRSDRTPTRAGPGSGSVYENAGYDQVVYTFDDPSGMGATFAETSRQPAQVEIGTDLDTLDRYMAARRKQSVPFFVEEEQAPVVQHASLAVDDLSMRRPSNNSELFPPQPGEIWTG